MSTYDSNVRGESRFLPNTAALIIHTLIATIITFLQVKILASYLTKDTFGLFVSLRGLSLLIATLAANGFPQLLVRFFPELESKKRRESALWLYLCSSFAPLIVIMLAFLLVGELKAYVFAFMSSADLPGELLFWFWVTTFGWALKLVVYGGLNGIRRLTVHAVLDLVALIVQLGWIFLQRDALDLTVLFMITGVVSVAEALVGAAAIIWFLLRVSPSDDRPSSVSSIFRTDTRRYAGYWGWAVGLSVVAVAFTDVDRYLLSQVIAMEMLALFHIGSRITRLANRLLGVPNLAFQPEITRLETEGRSSQTVLATSVFMKFSAGVSVFFAATLIAFAGEVITIVANERYTGAAPLLTLLALSMPLSALTAPLTSVMKALDRVRGALYCDLIWATAYVSLLLVLSSRFGIIGAGYAQLLACLAQLLMATRLSRMPMKLRFSAELGWSLFLCWLVAFAPLFTIEILFGWTPLGSITAVKAALFVFACFVFRKMAFSVNILSAEEEEILRDMFERRGLGWVAGWFLRPSERRMTG